MALTKTQDTNYKYFLEHLDEWLEDLAYKGKYVVIYEQKVQKIQDDFKPSNMLSSTFRARISLSSR